MLFIPIHEPPLPIVWVAKYRLFTVLALFGGREDLVRNSTVAASGLGSLQSEGTEDLSGFSGFPAGFSGVKLYLRSDDDSYSEVQLQDMSISGRVKVPFRHLFELPLTQR